MTLGSLNIAVLLSDVNRLLDLHEEGTRQANEAFEISNGSMTQGADSVFEWARLAVV